MTAMTHQSEPAHDAPPAYAPQLLSSTSLPRPGGPQGPASQEQPLLVDLESQPQPQPQSQQPQPQPQPQIPTPNLTPTLPRRRTPSAPSVPSPGVPQQTERPQNSTRSLRLVPPTAPADRLSWAPSHRSLSLTPPTAPADPSSLAPEPLSRPSVARYLTVNGRRRLLQLSSRVSNTTPRIREQAAAAAAEERSRMDAEVPHEARTAEKERERIVTQERLRHLLSQACPDEEECRSILQTCAESCAAKGVDFAALLQEPIMVGHLPVYWAIIKSRAATAVRPRARRDADALILTILDFSRPLRNASVVAVRRGCMTVSDNILFRRLCGLFKEFAPPVSDTDELLLEGSGAEDSIVIEEQRGNDAEFTARIKLSQFLLRMRMSKVVYVEFVTRDRIWCLTFSDVFSSVSAEKWPWTLTLQLGEHSSPAWVDGRLVILRHTPAPAPSNQSSFIPVPLKCHWRQLQPLSTRSISSVLDKNVTDSLTSFVDDSGVLNIRFEAKLVKPSDDGCVVS